MSDILLEARGITKIFPGVKALDRVNLTIKQGEVHGLIGENGAGKSTIIKVLAGVHMPEEGQISFLGQACGKESISQALRRGISVIYQELCLVPHMKVYENIMLGFEDGKGDLYSAAKTREKAEEIISMLDLDLPLDEEVYKLDIAVQQMVEIAKAFSRNSRLIIMDEPTSSLDSEETEHLFRTIRDLKSKGVAIIYISHRMEEIFEICDKVTVLRNGENVGTLDTKAATNDELVSLIIGRKLEQYFPQLPPAPGEDAPKVLEVKDLVNRKLAGVSFSLRKGEILGLFGLVGAGRSETARAIFGLDYLASGEIYIEGNKVKLGSPHRAMKNGISFLTENRREEGLVLKMDIRRNLTFPILDRISVPGAGYVRRKKEMGLVKDAFSRFLIKATGPEQRSGTLSGGNQQKVVLSKWFMTESKVLILDEPTRGVDVGAKAEIYELITEMVSKGLSVIMISCEESEMLGMCHRILVMRDGEIIGEFNREDATQEKLVGLCMGGKTV